MAKMPSLLDLMAADRNRSQADAMTGFFNAVMSPVSARPTAAPQSPAVIPAPAAAPAVTPSAAPSMATTAAPAPAQERGLLGGFFGPEGRDARARLAIALEGMTMNPNQALVGELQRGIQARETAAQRNKTVEWLRSRGHNDLADALETGSVDAASVVNEALAREKPAQAGYRQVTGAQIGLTGADAQKLFNVSPDGQITAIGGAGTTINVGAGGKLDEEFAKLDAQALAQVSQAGIQAVRNMGRIDQLETLLANAPQGAEGGLKMAAGRIGINTEGLSEAQAAQAIINSLVPEQRAPGSGPMSDADLALFKESLPQIINQPGGNALIIGTMRAIAAYDAQGAEITQRFRAGEIDSAEAFRLLQSRPDPFANFRVPAGTGEGAGETTMTPEEASRILLENSLGR